MAFTGTSLNLSLKQFPIAKDFCEKYLSFFVDENYNIGLGTLPFLKTHAGYQVFDYSESVRMAWESYYMVSMMNNKSESSRQNFAIYMDKNKEIHINLMMTAMSRTAIDI